MIEFHCLKCLAEIRVKDSAAGKKGTCNKCGSVLTVPESTPATDDFDDWLDISEEDHRSVPQYSSRPKVSSTSKKQIQKKSVNPLLWMGFAVLCVLAVSVPATLAITGFLQKETPIVKADVADSLKNPTYAISGEMFVTTKGGDIKKAAGVKIRAIPLTEEFVKSLKFLVEERRSLSLKQNEFYKEWESKNPRPLTLEDAEIVARVKMKEWRDLRTKDDLYNDAMVMNEIKSEDLLNSERLKANLLTTTSNSNGAFKLSVDTDVILISEKFRSCLKNLAECKLVLFYRRKKSTTPFFCLAGRGRSRTREQTQLSNKSF